MPLVAFLLVAVAVAGPEAPEPRDPCPALRTPLASGSVPARVRRGIDAYRAAWRPVCDPQGGPVDLGTLFGDAEALATDAALADAVDEILRSAPPGAPSPLPGIRQSESGSAAVDWGAFEAVVERGWAEDQRFWRAASRALDLRGDPVWLGPAAGGGPRCVRLGQVAWADVAAALELMETTGVEPYVRVARALRGSLLAALEAIAKEPVCGCTKGDAPAGLEPLAASGEKRGTPTHRALAKAARDALEALRTGRARVGWLRDAPGAPPTGCRPGES